MLGSPRRPARLGWIAALALSVLAATAHAQGVLDVAGIYDVQGETIVPGSPDRLVITGKIVVRQNGTDLDTITEVAMRRAAGSSGPSSAALIGTGTAKLDGRKITGTSELQSLVSQVPELDVAAPYTPRLAGPVLNTTANGVVRDDGTIDFEIHSTLTGEGFTLPEGRKTTLRAKRVARKATELKKKP